MSFVVLEEPQPAPALPLGHEAQQPSLLVPTPLHMAAQPAQSAAQTRVFPEYQPVNPELSVRHS
jgi:hypothetical protein